MQPIQSFKTEKPWGNFEQFTNNESSTVKIITIRSNEELSLQSHKKRREFWRVISGDGVFEISDEKFSVSTGDEYNIAENTKHRMYGGEDGLVVLEIATGEFDEDDIVRYEDKYGRV